MFRCFRRDRRWTVENAINQMRRVESVLHDMIAKYERLRGETREQLLRQTKKSRKLMLLKKIKTLDHYIRTCENRIAVCVNKQYALEQLEVTKMQIEAIRASTSVFRRWSKYNPIQKIEDLQDSMEDQMENLSDVTGLLEQTHVEFDEDELMTELVQLDTEEQIQDESSSTLIGRMPDAPVNVPGGGSGRVAVMV